MCAGYTSVKKTQTMVQGDRWMDVDLVTNVRRLRRTFTLSFSRINAPHRTLWSSLFSLCRVALEVFSWVRIFAEVFQTFLSSNVVVAYVPRRAFFFAAFLPGSSCKDDGSLSSFCCGCCSMPEGCVPFGSDVSRGERMSTRQTNSS